jgi:hypothetical protein
VLKRILLFSSILFVGIVVGVVVWVQNEGQTAPLLMKEKIQAAAKEIQVQDILQSHSIDDGLEAVLFLLKDGQIGYALVKDEEVHSVSWTDTNQSYDQYQHHVILLGKKEDPAHTRLTATIIRPLDQPKYYRTVELGEDEYYLASFEIPEEDGQVRFGEDGWRFK